VYSEINMYHFGNEKRNTSHNTSVYVVYIICVGEHNNPFPVVAGVTDNLNAAKSLVQDELFKGTKRGYVFAPKGNLSQENDYTYIGNIDDFFDTYEKYFEPGVAGFVIGEMPLIS